MHTTLTPLFDAIEGLRRRIFPGSIRRGIKERPWAFSRQ